MDSIEQQDLLDLIAGKGRWAWSGSAGFHTYPCGDENAIALHLACVELERQGLIVRVLNEPEHVCWKVPNEQS